MADTPLGRHGADCNKIVIINNYLDSTTGLVISLMTYPNHRVLAGGEVVMLTLVWVCAVSLHYGHIFLIVKALRN